MICRAKIKGDDTIEVIVLAVSNENVLVADTKTREMYWEDVQNLKFERTPLTNYEYHENADGVAYTWED